MVLFLFFPKGKKETFAKQVSVLGEKNIFQISREKTKQQDKRKMLGGVCKDRKKSCDPNNKKRVVPFDLGIGPPKDFNQQCSFQKGHLGSCLGVLQSFQDP